MPSRTSQILTIMLLTLVLVFSMRASANGLPSTIDNFRSPAEALTSIFLLNILVNLAMLSGFLLLSCRLLGRAVGRVSSSTLLFLASTIVAAMVITAIGAIVDFALLLSEYPFGYEFVYDPILWLVAIVVIFTSILAASLFFLNLSLKAALIPAIAISALNPLWWLASLTMPGGIVIFISLTVSGLLVPLLLLGLSKWHKESGTSKNSRDGSASSAT